MACDLVAAEVQAEAQEYSRDDIRSKYCCYRVYDMVLDESSVVGALLTYRISLGRKPKDDDVSRRLNRSRQQRVSTMLSGTCECVYVSQCVYVSGE